MVHGRHSAHHVRLLCAFHAGSHQELMEQVESTTEELHKTNERLRAVEAQRLAAVREAELLKARIEQQEAGLREARRSMKQR